MFRTIILREHTLFLAKVQFKTVSDLIRYINLVLWQHSVSKIIFT